MVAGDRFGARLERRRLESRDARFREREVAA